MIGFGKFHLPGDVIGDVGGNLVEQVVQDSSRTQLQERVAGSETGPLDFFEV